MVSNSRRGALDAGCESPHSGGRRPTELIDSNPHPQPPTPQTPTGRAPGYPSSALFALLTTGVRVWRAVVLRW